jgi:hypothetical protein
MSKDNALSFVGQIMTAYKAIMKAEGGALAHAIECGKYLALAKENVEAAKPKRKWGAWLEEHCPDIHRNTAALYMRLADNAEEIADCTSIREADMKLRQPSGDDVAQRVVQEDDDDAGESGGDEALRERVVRKLASQDLTCTLQNVGVDEVYTALIDAWDEDHIRQLCDRLRDHFMKPVERPPRQPLPQPTLS